jgi:hypothetical protein
VRPLVLPLPVADVPSRPPPEVGRRQWARPGVSLLRRAFPYLSHGIGEGLSAPTACVIRGVPPGITLPSRSRIAPRGFSARVSRQRRGYTQRAPRLGLGRSPACSGLRFRGKAHEGEKRSAHSHPSPRASTPHAAQGDRRAHAVGHPRGEGPLLGRSPGRAGWVPLVELHVLCGAQSVIPGGSQKINCPQGPSGGGLWLWRAYRQHAAVACQHSPKVLDYRMGTAARYLREAEAAEATARSLTDSELRRAFEDLANQWREMARRVGEPDAEADAEPDGSRRASGAKR